jgi:hypothetical protein
VWLQDEVEDNLSAVLEAELAAELGRPPSDGGRLPAQQPGGAALQQHRTNEQQHAGAGPAAGDTVYRHDNISFLITVSAQ